ncbi:MAG: hypothetical protein Kow0069_06820 [Promethearchaeota archaeon]
MTTPSEDVVGVFVGLESSAYEYVATIISPYQVEFALRIGGFLLIDNGSEYIVARVTDYVPKGELTTFMGQKWLAEVALDPGVIGQDIKRSKVAYHVRIRLLGRLEKGGDGNFVPGLARIPHITSKVLVPDTGLVKKICSQAIGESAAGIELGSYWLDGEVPVTFDLGNLVGKRTFIFARAGYGKSNLVKVLASSWKRENGALFVFDPEGEYSVTDKKGRPGVMDVAPAILITNRQKISEELGKNVYGVLKFNLSDFSPKFVVPILVPEAKHETIFFQKLMSLRRDQWSRLVDLFHEDGWAASPLEISRILKNLDDDVVETDDSAVPVSNNLVRPIQRLHDPNSRLIDILELAARRGDPVIMDISLMDSHTALQFCSIVVSHFFNKNQQAFIGGREDLFKVVFVVEEAQSVIGGKTNVGKFVELAKEGRKYGLGAVFVTQQPGSISREILSQGDNFFVFHLLSRGDLKALREANAHYSTDILTQILSEPIPGKAHSWTSHQPFVLPVRVKNFEDLAKPHHAREVQANENLLEAVLGEVEELATLEQSILEKFVRCFRAVGLEQKPSLTTEDKRQVTVPLFSQLTEGERKFLEERGGLAKGIGGQPFAVHYSYFDKLLVKAREKKLL